MIKLKNIDEINHRFANCEDDIVLLESKIDDLDYYANYVDQKYEDVIINLERELKCANSKVIGAYVLGVLGLFVALLA